MGPHQHKSKNTAQQGIKLFARGSQNSPTIQKEKKTTEDQLSSLSPLGLPCREKRYQSEFIPKRPRFYSEDLPSTNHCHTIKQSGNRFRECPDPKQIKDEYSSLKLLTPLSKNKKRKSVLLSRKESSDYCNEFKNNYKVHNKMSLLLHLAHNLSRNVQYDNITDALENAVPNYIYDWAYVVNKQTMVAYWKKKGEVSLTSEKVDEIGALSAREAKGANDYYIKRLWLHKYINVNLFEHKADNPPLIISREKILEDSYNQFMTTSDLSLKKPIQIHFIDEVAHDIGGVHREWYTCLFNAFFNESNKVFKRNKSNALCKDTFLLSDYNSSEVDFGLYEFFGKVLAKAIVDKVMINENLNIVLIKRLLNTKCTIDDLIYYDIDIETSMRSINAIEDDKTLKDFFFVWEEKEDVNSEKLIEIELVPNGKNICVNKINKADFIAKVIEYITYDKYKEKIERIRKGINNVIPEKVLGIFKCEEFAFLISGQQEIDINDWKRNTVYKGKYEKGLEHPVIKMFWDCMGEMENEKLVAFFQFSTGALRVPVDGFAALKGIGNKFSKFCIEDLKEVNSLSSSKGIRLIEAKTCFNRIYVPEYKTKDEMRRAINIIIQSDTNYFGLD